MAEPAAAPRPLRRRIGLLLWWAGLALLLAGIVLLVAGVDVGVPPLAFVGGGLILLGLNVLLNGDFTAGPEPRAFTARGQVVRAELNARAGLSDMTVGPGMNDRIASVRYGPLGKPSLDVTGGVANLRLKTSLFPPNIARWEAQLAPNILWDVSATCTLGDLTLDLRDLRLENVTARSTLGRLHLTLPERGYTQMGLSTLLGEVEVTLPEQAGTRIRVETGALARVKVENERLRETGPGRYVTPDYDLAPAQVEITIHSTAGDVYLT